MHTSKNNKNTTVNELPWMGFEPNILPTKPPRSQLRELWFTDLPCMCTCTCTCRYLAVLEKEGDSHGHILEQLVSETDDHAVQVLPHPSLQHGALDTHLQSLQEHWQRLEACGRGTTSPLNASLHYTLVSTFIYMQGCH